MFGGIRYKLFSSWPFPPIKPSTEEIDVVIPAIKKDLKILPLCIQGIRNMVNHPLREIYIVAPFQEEIIRFCKENNVQYIDESTPLGITPIDINLIISEADGNKINRSGWLFQQLIKLSGNIGTCEHYLCIDADHILIRPHTFISYDKKPVFYMSNERIKPYIDNIKKTLHIKPLSLLSYVSHKMIFNKKQLNHLHQRISSISDKNWIETILSNYDRSQISGFSEFESYGNFIKEKYRRPWKQLALPSQEILDYKTLQDRYSNKYWSITYPSYLL